MIVTEIKRQTKNDRYAVYVDGSYAFSLILTDILFFKLKEGKEIPEEKFCYIRDTSLYIQAQETALQYISGRMKTERQVREKLKQKDFSEELIEKVLGFLKNYHYVDDGDYCRRYIRESKRLKPKGERLLTLELKQKGIPEEIIQEALQEEGVDEAEGAYQLLQKKVRFKKMDDTMRRRAVGLLQRKGYSYDVIRDAFRRVKEEMPEEEGEDRWLDI